MTSQTSTDSAFQVGDEVECTCFGRTWQARVIELYDSLVGLDSSGGVGLETRRGLSGWWVTRDTLRKLPTPDQSGGKAPVEAKRDPYKQDRPPGFVPWAALQDERHRQTLAALDRKIEPVRRGLPDRSRGATICTRHLATPKRVKDGHPAAWPSVGDDEP
jgi:hypothetical protein